jgi:hypothetical protein
MLSVAETIAANSADRTWHGPTVGIVESAAPNVSRVRVLCLTLWSAAIDRVGTECPGHGKQGNSTLYRRAEATSMALLGAMRLGGRTTPLPAPVVMRETTVSPVEPPLS